MDSTLETWGWYHMQDIVKLARKFDNKDVMEKSKKPGIRTKNVKWDNQKKELSDPENQDSNLEDNLQIHLSRGTNHEDKASNTGRKWLHCRKLQGKKQGQDLKKFKNVSDTKDEEESLCEKTGQPQKGKHTSSLSEEEIPFVHKTEYSWHKSINHGYPSEDEDSPPSHIRDQK